MAIGIVIGIVIVSVILFFVISSGQEKKLLSTLYQYERNKQYSQAIEISKKLIKKKSKIPIYYIGLANLYIKNKQIKEAISIYLTMLRQNLFSGSISKKMILEQVIPLLIQIKDTANAWKLIQDLLTIDSKNTVAFISLSRIYAGQEKLSEAAGYLKRVLDRDPNNSDAHFYYGLVLLDSGNLRNGVVELEKSLRLNKRNPKALYFLALGYGQLGYKDKKEKILKVLNISMDSNLPANIVKAGILRISSKISIDQLEKQNTKKTTIIKDFHSFLSSSGEGFYSTAVHIIKRLGISIKDKMDIDADPTSELYFIGDYKKQKALVHFYKTETPISSIALSNFLTALDNHKLPLGIYITTSHLSDSAISLINKEEHIIVFDKSKILRFF